MAQKEDRLVKDQPTEKPAEPGPLAAYKGDKPPAPIWFETAVSKPYETGYAECRGARIHYQRWGDRRKPGLLLVHGNGAHGHWWDFVAPYLTDEYHVAAMTFSGMGDSNWREAYDMETFAQEQLAVADATGMFDVAQKPIIVAHSFGGFVTILTGAEYGDQLTGTVIVDSPVNPPDRQRPSKRRTARNHRIYPDLAAALARFRLAPPQPCENHYVMDYIARWSLKEVHGDEPGWTWKFDPAIWRSFNIGRSSADCLRETKCRIAIFRGEQSVLMPDYVRDYMTHLLDRQVPFITIPEARHHVMLDQPLAFVSALRTLLQEWTYSAPKRAVPARTM